MSELTLTTENFDQTVLQSDKPLLVDFWASWCGPCRIMSPIVEQVAQEMPDVAVGTLNVDEHPEVAQRFNVLSIPTFIIFKGGQVVHQMSGAMPKEKMVEVLKRFV